MRVAITGPNGFIAWHTRCAIKAASGLETVGIGREEFLHDERLDKALAEVDAVIHLAGINRSATDGELVEANIDLANRLLAGLRRAGRPITVVYGDSIQRDTESAFGQSKRAAGNVLSAWADMGPVVDVVLPNVFGEHGTPFYNSVTATFCSQVANGLEPEIHQDRPLPLLHAQGAAKVLIDACSAIESTQTYPVGRVTLVSELLKILRAIAGPYQASRTLPDLSDQFTRDLFNTFRSHIRPTDWPAYPPPHEDERGVLYEAVQAIGGETQVFFSSTGPGHRRGQHFHLHKVERFVVLRGSGLIRLRRLFDDETIEIPVSGDRPAVLDMPTMWVHSIENIGSEELVTLFFADAVFDPANPDTYQEDV